MIRNHFQGFISDLIITKKQEIIRFFPENSTWKVLTFDSVWVKIMKRFYNSNKMTRKIFGINTKILLQS